MTGLHSIVGAIVLLLFLAATILYILRIGGRDITAGKYVSYLASLFLFIQYLIGIGLIAGGYRNKWYHYVLAVLVIVPVGLEHGVIRKQFTGREQACTLALDAAAATILVLITYLVGQAGAK